MILINSFAITSYKLTVPFIPFLYRFFTYKVLNSHSPYGGSKLLFYSYNKFKFSVNFNKISYCSSLLLYCFGGLNIIGALSII